MTCVAPIRADNSQHKHPHLAEQVGAAALAKESAERFVEHDITDWKLLDPGDEDDEEEIRECIEDAESVAAVLRELSEIKHVTPHMLEDELSRIRAHKLDEVR